MDMEILLQFITRLRDTGLIDFLGILVSTAVPLLVLFVTLRNQKKQNIEALKQQALIHRESIKKMEQEHRESMRLQDEFNRIHAMPFFILKKDARTHTKSDNLFFTLYFVNAGNGTATCLATKYVDDEINIIYDDGLGRYTCACPFNYEKSVVRPDEECTLEISREIFHPEYQFNSPSYLEFSILYCDMYGRKYQQTFSISYQYQDNVQNFRFDRVENHCPTLLEHHDKSYSGPLVY